MVTMEEIRKRKKIDYKEWMILNKELEVIITDTSAQSSHFIYQLMFLVEGRKFGLKNVLITIIDDGGVVGEQDILTGLYIDSDKGKNRARVLQRRYSGVFSQTIFVVHDLEGYLTNEKSDTENSDSNKIVIGFGKVRSYTTSLFQDLLNIRMQANVCGGLAMIQGNSISDSLEINSAIYRKYGDVVGDYDLDDYVGSKRSVGSLIQRGQMLSQTMLNFLNLLITEDTSMGGLPYLMWSMDIENGKQKHEYLTKELTYIHKKGRYIDVLKRGVSESIVYDVDAVIQNSLNRNKAEYEDKLKSRGNAYNLVIQQYKNTIKAAINSQVDTLQGKLFRGEREQYERKVVLSVMIDAIGSGKTRKTKEENTMYYAIIKEIERMGISLL